MFWEILKASKGLPVTDPLAALWGQKIAEGGAWQLTTITGTLPLTVLANGKALKDYKIYGTSEGSGVRTENLLDKNSEDNMLGYSIRTSTGEIVKSAFFTVTHKIDVTGGQPYVAEIFNPETTAYIYAVEYDEDDQFVKTTGITTTGGTAYRVATLNAATTYVRMSLLTSLLRNLIFVPGSTPPDYYIPYGYKLPLTVTADGAATDYPVYIGDSQLMEDEYVDYVEQKIYKLVDGVLTPTDPPVPLPEIALPKGEATIDIEGELKPQAEITGEIKEVNN